MSISTRRKAGIVTAVIALAVCGAAQARADSTSGDGADAIKLKLDSVTQVGSLFTYTYTVKLTADAQVLSGAATVGDTLAPTDGDYLGIFDIPGYAPGSVGMNLTTAGSGASWVATTPLSGYQSSLGTHVPDDPSLVNVDIQYVQTDGGSTGPQTIAAGGSDLILGQVWFQSTNPQSTTANLTYCAQDFDTFAGSTEMNSASLVGPSNITNPTPEPASLGLLALGGLPLLKRRSR